MTNTVLQTLINEMSLQPFNKSNCVAMLNTLYPPATKPPTAQLTKEVLAVQRNGFFRYIQSVEKAGPGLLKTLIDQGKGPDHETGWTSVRDIVDRYLRAANNIIDECHEIIGRDSLSSPPQENSALTEKEIEEQRARKVDSGISFASSKSTSSSQHRVSSSMSSATSSVKSREKLPKTITTEINEVPTKPAGSTLERIAREIRRIKSRGDIGDTARKERSRTRGTADADVPKMNNGPELRPEEKEKKIRFKPSLKKMRSRSTLGERDRNVSSSGNMYEGRNEKEITPDFNVDEMRRRRMAWEAKDSKDVSTKDVNTNLRGRSRTQLSAGGDMMDLDS